MDFSGKAKAARTTGYDVFLCHATPDKPAVETLAEKLKDNALNPWLDKWNIILGSPAPRQLSDAIDHSACCVIFIGPGGNGPWQSQEIQAVTERQARDSSFRVIPVRLPGAPAFEDLEDIPIFVKVNPGVDFTHGLQDEDALTSLIAGIQGRARGPGKVASPLRRRSSHQVGELAISLALKDDYLHRCYFSRHGGLLLERRSQWPPIRQKFEGWFAVGIGAIEEDAVGEALYNLLFQDGEANLYPQLFRAIHPDKPQSNPNRYPLRIRLHINHPDLANLPWSCLRWEGCGPRDMDWAIELGGEAETANEWPTSNPVLIGPCTMLIVAPLQERLDSGTHVAAMQGKLLEIWPRADRPRVAGNLPAIREAIDARKPRIVYFYGPARGTEHSLQLGLDDRRWIELGELASTWGRHPPQMLFLNLVGDWHELQAAWAVRRLRSWVPLVVVQPWPQHTTRQARDSAVLFLDRLLTASEDWNPVEHLHEHGLCTAVAWTGYDNWLTRSPEKSVVVGRQLLAHLMLDRENQRAKALQTTMELTNQRQRRMSCLLCYGGPGNLADRFSQQIETYIKGQAGDVFHLKPIPLALPTGETFTEQQLDECLRQCLNLDPRTPLKKCLQRYRSGMSPTDKLVLLLDWQVRRLDTAPLRVNALRTWLSYCVGRLANLRIDGIYFLGCLVLEAPVDRHRQLADVFKSLGDDARFRTGTLRLEVLDPLHEVERGHLTDYLEREDCQCPTELYASLPDLILRATGGHFERTAGMIDQAENFGWYGLYDRLRKDGEAPPDAEPGGGNDEGDLLL